MRRCKILSIFLHAGKMVIRTLNSYALLSVTIVLTFSLFLGYLLYMDSSAYNEYKKTFATRREMLYFEDRDVDNVKLNLFLEKAEALAQYDVCYVYTILGGALDTLLVSEENLQMGNLHYETLGNWQVAFVPANAWVGDVYSSPGVYDADYPYDLSRITWLDGKEHKNVTLAKDEALLPEQLYYALGLDEMENPEYTFQFEGSGSENTGGIGTMTLRIVGLLKDDYPLIDQLTGEVDRTNYINRILISQRSMPAIEDISLWNRKVFIYTESPEVIAQLAETLGYIPHSVYAQQNEALAQMRYQMGSKAVIAAALLLLLGINLYSCYSNVLNDRKFEIGVKRAVGASAWSIVRQFVYESLMVVLANIAVSVALVGNIFIVYKFIYEHIPDEQGNFHQWTVYISSYSVAMFLVCAGALTVVFSLIFAYKSTKVEIVKYLKAE